MSSNIKEIGVENSMTHFCKGLCELIEKGTNYTDSKYCRLCTKFLKVDLQFCKCCGDALRHKPRYKGKRKNKVAESE